MANRILLAILISAAAPALMMAQGGRGGGRGQQPPASPKADAREDLTGYWVSVVTEDYRWRMITPLKGDAASVPINDAARKIVDAWDPAKDEAAGQQCRAYGAAAIMRVPGRLHITWQNDNTLKIETDSGTQTRLFHFGAQPPAEGKPSWQGFPRRDGSLELHPHPRARAWDYCRAPARARGLWKFTLLSCCLVICARTASLTATARP